MKLSLLESECYTEKSALLVSLFSINSGKGLILQKPRFEIEISVTIEVHQQFFYAQKRNP